MSTSTIGLWPGVYLVKAPIPELAAFPGDHVTVAPGQQHDFMLHRDLNRFHIETMLRSGSVERVGDIMPASYASASAALSGRPSRQLRVGGPPLRLLP